MDPSPPAAEKKIAPAWKPLTAIQRRVLGVLVEKAKTTPDGYPMSLNALVTGSNQKNNREPHTELTANQVEDALEQLRMMGAASEVYGSGRVPKYKHHAYEWFGVESEELAVLCELLLRGTQSVGDLRARAARMAKIAGQEELRPILQSLMTKNLVLALTPEGRGQIVTHGLWLPDELARQKQKAASLAPGLDEPAAPATVPIAPPPAAVSPAGVPRAMPAPSFSPSAPAREEAGLAELRQEVAELKAEVARLKQEVKDLWDNLK